MDATWTMIIAGTMAYILTTVLFTAALCRAASDADDAAEQ